MQRMFIFAVAVLLVTLAAAGARPNGLKRMYVLDCGRLIARDQSRWTPGVNAGQPRELSNSYLIQHERGSTPGHTPGHQSLLVKLPKTGALILTGDLVHFQYMWDHKVVPPFNFNKEQSLASIERVVKLLAEHKAQLWIGHDKDITARIDRAPKFYE